MTGDERASSAERQEEPPPWQPAGWQVPVDPSVPPYGAPPGWQPPPPPAPAPSEAFGPDTGVAWGWHGVGTPTGGGYQPPAGQQPYGQQVYGQPPPYGQPPGPYGGYPRPSDTNGFAIASLVCSLVGILVVVVGPGLGIIFGILALRQLNTRRQSGRGLAIAGIVVGGIVLLIDVLGIIGLATGAGDSSGGGGLSTLHAAALLTAWRSSR